jgi:hypothetical protein
MIVRAIGYQISAVRYADLTWFMGAPPSDESLGYFRSSATRTGTASTKTVYLIAKIQNPVTSSAARRRQAGDGIISGEKIPTAA